MSASPDLWARRTAIAGFGAGAFAASFAALSPIQAARRPRVVVLDWGLAATVLSLGVTPVGVPQTKLYRRWLETPKLPGRVTDVGLRLQPNLEVLWRLRPDIIIVIDQHEAIRERLERIAPTLALPVYTPSTQPLQRARVVTRRLGEALDQPAQATELIDCAEQVFAQTRSDLSGVDVPPLYLADVLDARHIRLFGRRSLFGNVLDALGLANAWRGSTSYWGSVTVGPAKLAAVPEAGWVRVTSLDPSIRQKLGDSRLWKSLPFVQAGRMAALEPVLPFGALPSAMRFATQLGQRLPVALGNGGR